MFIYGGAFQWGSADVFLYDGAANTALNDHIFVSFNYRVGVFGFLNHPDLPELSGSIGFWDQNMALRWVKDNIQYFGGRFMLSIIIFFACDISVKETRIVSAQTCVLPGDPDNVTVCGHSAGAISAAVHAISPHAKGEL